MSIWFANIHYNGDDDDDLDLSCTRSRAKYQHSIDDGHKKNSFPHIFSCVCVCV